MKIAQGNGYESEKYRKEILPYQLPGWLSARLMKRMLAFNRAYTPDYVAAH